MTEILTPRLRLRRAAIGDLHDLHALLGNPIAMRYWSTLPHDRLEQTRAWLDGMIAAPPDASDDFIVEHCGRVIGKAGCWRLPEIGFIFHPDCWGQGFASEALTAVIDRVFAGFPIPAIRADVDPRNRASLRLLSRLGFREVGRAQRTWKIGDEWCDSAYLELARPADRLRGSANAKPL
jgi:[ribosomal protein S5]-alanine N-acetyltransferase